MQDTELPSVVWRKSKRSGGDNGSQCVEMAKFADYAAVRDSKLKYSTQATASPLIFAVDAVSAFVAAIKENSWNRN